MQNNQKAYQLFSSFKNKYYKDESQEDQTNDPFDLDDEMKHLLQKINKQSKKSSTTRIKALQQTSILLSEKEDAYIESFLKIFTIIYEKLLTCEEDTKVLLELQKCMKVIIEKSEGVVKKKFANLFHYLYFATFESNKELSEMSRNNLSKILKSDDKIARSTFVFRDKIFAFALNILGNKTEFVSNMSIYDDKEVNEIIYKKLVSMVWWALADMVEKSRHLKPEESCVLLAKISDVTLGGAPDNILSLTTFNGAGDDYIVKTAILYFWSLLLRGKMEVDKIVLKKIVQAILLTNLDDANNSFQTVLWKDGFVLRVLELGRQFNINQETIQKRFINLVENHCYGVAGGYYEYLEKSIELFMKDDTQGRVEGVFKKVVLAHFKSVTKDDLKFDIKEHYKVGFAILKTQILNSKITSEENDKKKKQKFEFFSVEFLTEEIIEQINEIFLSQNNPMQKNLNAISINLVKFYPQELGIFLSNMQQSEFQTKSVFCDFMVSVFGKLSQKVFENSAEEPKQLANFSLCLKYFLGSLEIHEQKEERILGRIVSDSFQKMSANFKNCLEKINDQNFKQIIAQLTNISNFTKELGEKNLTNFCEVLSKKEPEFAKNFDEFVDFVSVNFSELIVSQKINQRLFDPESLELMSVFFSDFMKQFSFKMNFDFILSQLRKYCSTFVLEIVSKKQWKKILQIMLEGDVLKTMGTSLNEMEKDFGGFINKIGKLKIGKNNDFSLRVLESNEFWAFFEVVLDLIFKRNLPQLSVFILIYFNLEKKKGRVILGNYLKEYFGAKKVDELNSIEMFKISLAFEFTKDQNVEQKTQIFESILNFLQKFDEIQTGVFCVNFAEISASLDVKSLELLLEIFVKKLIVQKSNGKKYMNIFKAFAKLSEKSFREMENKSFSEFVENEIVIYFNEYQENEHTTTDIFRIVHKKIPQLIFSEIVGKIVVRFIKTSTLNNKFLVNFVSQPIVIHNFSAKKQQEFWNELINGVFLSALVKIFQNEVEFFEKIFFSLLESSLSNFSLIVFIKKVVKQILNDDSNQKQVQKSLLNSLFDYFDAEFLKNNENPQILFVYKGVFSSISLKSFYDSEEILAKIKKTGKGLKQTLEILLGLKNELITNEKIGKNTLEIFGCDLEISNLGKVLHVQVEFLKEKMKVRKNEAFSLTLFLEYLDFAIEKHEEEVLANNSILLEENLVQILKMAEDNFAVEFSQNCFYSFLILLRKLISVLEMFSEEFKTNVFKKISMYSFRFSLGIKNNQYLQSEFWTVPPKEFFNEIAETISRFAIREDVKITLDELFELLEIEINSVKKSSFFLIQKFKQPFGISPKQAEYLEGKENALSVLLFEFPVKLAALISGKSQEDGFTYLLKWAYVLQSCNGQTEEAQGNLTVMSKVFNEERQIFSLLMDRIFGHFYDRNLNAREVEDLVSKLDFTNPEKQWGEVINEEVRENFAIHVFYNLTFMFPKNLRVWLENEKKLGGLAMGILKAGVSEAIYNRELDKIELTQHEWKSDDFDVFFNKNTREIFAIYMKDDCKFEIVLTVPNNFPVKPIGIKVTGANKAGEDKEKRWKLLITRSLTGQNNNIIDALVLWKKNMDAEFDLVEPCPICYYIIHPTSKKRPTMACKTCKKLLHGECVRQWFTSSQKSDCPLCKSQFM